MAAANPLWGAPRIHGELLKLGIPISERTVSRLLPRKRRPPSQTWKAFLDNHLNQLVSIDFFTVPTATFRVLFVLVVLAHCRRRVVHFNVAEHPTAAWTAQQILEAAGDYQFENFWEHRSSSKKASWAPLHFRAPKGAVCVAPHVLWSFRMADLPVGFSRQNKVLRAG